MGVMLSACCVYALVSEPQSGMKALMVVLITSIAVVVVM